MKQTALITGASRGIGRELAILFAADGHDLVLVARSREGLEELGRELAGRHGISVRVIALDLAAPDGPQRVYEDTNRAAVAIDILVNNAGFGYAGSFAEGDTRNQMEMVQLNVAALTHLSRLFLPSMLSRGRGRILNVASTAAFQPGPLMAVYYATKAYVLSFSEALAEELRGSGVSVTVLCPGSTATGFQARARTVDARLKRIGLMDAKTVAEMGYRGMKKGKTIVITGLKNRMLAQSVRFSPRILVRKVTKWLNSGS